MISTVLTIASRELKAGFRTPLAWVVCSGFLLLSGFFFYGRVQWFNATLQQSALLKEKAPTLNEHVIAPYFQTIEIILIFLIPVLTMRAIAEERRSGTFEMMITSPVSVLELVLGKFLGISGIVLIMLSTSFVFPLVLGYFAALEMPPVLVGLLGLFLFTLCFVSLGIAVSACTSSQTVAGVVSVVLSLVFYAINLPAGSLGSSLSELLDYLSPPLHSLNFYRGVVDSQDLVYFISVILIGLFLSARVLDGARWRQ